MRQYLTTIALLAALVWTGCGTDQQPTAPGESTLDAAAKLAAAGDVEAVIQVQDRHTGRLMALAGVVGTGTGLGSDGNPAIVVFAERAEVAGIPGALDGVPVVVRVTEPFHALSHRPGHGSGTTAVNPASRFPRPVPIGVSTGHPSITAGTIGCRVKDLSGSVYALSNNHVYAASNSASIGDNALQPGVYDGGVNPDDAIGTLHAFVPIQFDNTAPVTGCPDNPSTCNTVDAAIALSSTANLGKSTPSNGYGTPKSTTVATRINQKVKKYGRTTSLTKGMVAALNATVDINYGTAESPQIARFVQQIVIQPGSFSAGGDSGSLIVDDTKTDNRKPVGLLFAGNSFYTIANPISPALAAFGVSVDGE